MTSFLFWFCLGYLWYLFCGFQLAIALKAKLLPRPVDKSCVRDWPRVSIVVAARNEAQRIGKRLANLVALNYPADRLEIIVVSDGSEDETVAIVQQFSREMADSQTIAPQNERPALRCQPIPPPSQGKPRAINRGVALAHGEIIVFADCRQHFALDAVKHLVGNFNDPDVGCVSGELYFVETPESSIAAEMGLYWRYERWLRRQESRSGSLPGATGAIYAIRRSLFRPLPETTLLDDVYIPMRIVMQGYRAIVDEHALAYDTVSRDFTQEKQRKVRTLSGNYQLLYLEPLLLSPWHNPILCRFISHKILRLFMPIAFLGAAVTGTLLARPHHDAVLIGLGALLGLPLLRNVAWQPMARSATMVHTILRLNVFALLALINILHPGKKPSW